MCSGPGPMADIQAQAAHDPALPAKVVYTRCGIIADITMCCRSATFRRSVPMSQSRKR